MDVIIIEIERRMGCEFYELGIDCEKWILFFVIFLLNSGT